MNRKVKQIPLQINLTIGAFAVQLHLFSFGVIRCLGNLHLMPRITSHVDIDISLASNNDYIVVFESEVGKVCSRIVIAWPNHIEAPLSSLRAKILFSLY